MKLGKIIFILIIVAGAYFALSYFGFLGNNLDKMRSLDSKYGISEAQLTPNSLEKSEQYYAEIAKINPANKEEEDLLEVKNSLAFMSIQMFIFSDLSSEINLNSPDCSSSGNVGLAKIRAQKALERANMAITAQPRVKNIKGFEYITSTDFSTTMSRVKASLESSINTLNDLC